MTLTTGQKLWRSRVAPHKLSPWQRDEILAMWKAGSTMTAIAKAKSCAISTVSRIINQAEKEKKNG